MSQIVFYFLYIFFFFLHSTPGIVLVLSFYIDVVWKLSTDINIALHGINIPLADYLWIQIWLQNASPPTTCFHGTEEIVFACLGLSLSVYLSCYLSEAQNPGSRQWQLSSIAGGIRFGDSIEMTSGNLTHRIWAIFAPSFVFRKCRIN